MNKYVQKNVVTEIYIKDKVILVDTDEVERLKFFNWYLTSEMNRESAKMYVKADYPKEKRKVYIHRHILGLDKASVSVDHINHDPLDNRKINLRIATASQQMANQEPYKWKKSSVYKGVSFARNSYFAYINKDKRRYRLGYFKSENEAAHAYNKKAVELFGEFAYLNQIL